MARVGSVGRRRADMTTSTATRWLSPAEQASWRSYLRGSRLLMEALDSALVEHGVRLTEYEILSMLSEAPGGRLRMSVLAGLVVQSRSRLTHTATRLERLGWVERRTCPEDRPAARLTLTPPRRGDLPAPARTRVPRPREHRGDPPPRDPPRPGGQPIAAA